MGMSGSSWPLWEILGDDWLMSLEISRGFGIV